MKHCIFRFMRNCQKKLLTHQGWNLGRNVQVSFHGVKKIGGGKIVCEDNVSINAETLLIASANIYIGKNSTLAYRTLLTTNANPNAPYNNLCKIYPPQYKDIWIGANVWIGAGAIVLPGCRIGNNCVIAAGSVVCNDIPDNVMAAGVPAKIKKKIEIED